jgi:hypothetical protein
MKGIFLTIAKHISELGRPTRFGPNWPGKRCLAKTRKGTPCQRPAFKHNGRCSLHGGLSTGAKTADGLKRISDANLKLGKYTKDKLEAQRYAAKVGRKVLAELKKIKFNLEQNNN